MDYDRQPGPVVGGAWGGGCGGLLRPALGNAGVQDVCIHVSSKTRPQVHKVPLVTKRPTACAFGGPDLGTLYVTTREEQGDGASQHHGALLAVRVPGVHGAAAAAECVIR